MVTYNTNYSWESTSHHIIPLVINRLGADMHNNTHMYAHVHTHTLAYARTHTHAHTRTHTRMHTHTYAHTYMHTHIHAHTHTRYTHIHGIHSGRFRGTRDYSLTPSLRSQVKQDLMY